MYRGHLLAAAGCLLGATLFGAAITRTATTRLTADQVLVKRNGPVPRSCLRSELGIIRWVGPPISPAWEFRTANDRVAFRVSAHLYDLSRLRALAHYLGVGLDMTLMTQID